MSMKTLVLVLLLAGCAGSLPAAPEGSRGIELCAIQLVGRSDSGIAYVRLYCENERVPNGAPDK